MTETNRPQWKNPTFIFNNTLNADVDSILFYVKHMDSASGEDVDLGMLVIPLDTFYSSPMITFDEWFPLRETPDMFTDDGESSFQLGKIRVSITFFNEADPNIVMPNIFAVEGGEKPPNLLRVRNYSKISICINVQIIVSLIVLDENRQGDRHCRTSELSRCASYYSSW
jgi:hypothetical protein